MARNVGPEVRAEGERLRAQGLSYRAIAERLEVGTRTVERWFSPSRDARREVIKVVNTETAPQAEHNVPPGYSIRGLSTLVDADGVPRLRWVKSARDTPDATELMATMRDEIAEWRERFVFPPVPVHPTASKDDYHRALLALYTLGDPHLGMLSWAPETGADFDTAIAERNLTTAMGHLVAGVPPAGEAVIFNAGDFFHAQSEENRTPRGGHALDADTRPGKVIRAGVRCFTRLIDLALTRHQRVTVICVPGNHDPVWALWLQLTLAFIYENEPRVVIDESPALMKIHEHGRCLFGFWHGHGIKPNAAPGMVAARWPEAWGRTRYRRIYGGHEHHERVKQYPGAVVETINTLAAPDAYTKSGWESDRSMFVDLWHAEHGKKARHEIWIEEVEALAERT